MSVFLPFIVIGLVTGSVYSVAALGLVLTYKTSGIFNLGFGAIAALVSFLFYFLHAEHGLDWPVTAVLCLLVFAPLAGLALELVARSLEGSTEKIKVVATIGFILLVVSLASLWHPVNPPSFPNFLSQSTVMMFSVSVTWAQIIVFAFSLIASAVLYWFFRSVRLGVVMRAVVDNPDLVAMSGDDPVKVRRWAWVIGTFFCGVAGLMLATTLPVDGITLTTEVYAAFGAAAIGYFSNLPLVFAGGLAIGIAQALMEKYSATISWIGGLPPGVPFIVLFIVLIVTPRRRLITQPTIVIQQQIRRAYKAPLSMRLLAVAVVLALLAMVPAIQASNVALWSGALIDIILFLSLGLLVRRSGQISLCHLTFAAVGCSSFGHFAAGFGLPWLVALLLAMLVAVPVGALIAIPAVRVSGVFSALATLGFSILATYVFFGRDFMFGASPLGISDPRPDFSIGGWNLSTNDGFYYLLLIIVVLVVVVLTFISQGRLGRLLEALADSPLALETHGASSSVLKVIVFCVAAAFASLAGALTGALFQNGNSNFFPPFTSVYLVAIVLLLTLGDPWYGVIGAILYGVVPGYIHGQNTSSVLQLLFGFGAVTVVYSLRMGGTPAGVQRLLDRVGRRTAPSQPPPLAVVAHVPLSVAKTPPTLRGEGLVVQDLSVRFGGIKAVNNISLKAPTGVITGLIGPNGAGKSTTFNVCSGLVRPASGRILFQGVDITHEGSAHRARRGLGRTFQRTELFNSLTVRQNVSMGREAALAGASPTAQLYGSRSANREVAAATDDALSMTRTAHIADVQVGLLPAGQRRLVELSRVLAGPFELLLLDEPSSGLDARETEEFGMVLKSVVREREWGILLVEHDMSLVRQVCDYLYVLDFGSLIFEGTPAEMDESEIVRAAYLGDLGTIVAGDDTLLPQTEPNYP